MNLISCTKEFRVDGNILTAEIDEHTDAIADALFDLEQCRPYLLDSAIGVDLAKKILEITVTVEHAGLEEGSAVATSVINSAIKTAGGNFGEKKSGSHPNAPRSVSGFGLGRHNFSKHPLNLVAQVEGVLCIDSDAGRKPAVANARIAIP